MTTFKGELKKLRKGQLKKKRRTRTKEERKLINDFIKERLRKEARNGKNTAEFSIVGYETIKNPENGESIYIKEGDYIRFAFQYRLKYAVYTDLNYKELNRIVLFF